jgi:signal transduction histidine kinase
MSHDFQTPLLNILGYTELLETETPSPDGKNTTKSIQTEAKRLSNLTKKLLVLTSLDQGTYPLQKQLVRLDEQLQSVVHSMMWWIQEKELEISFDLKPIEMNGDKSLLFNAWENLMSNAIKYNKRYGSIHIQCYEDEQAATVIIQDTGIGIDKSERDAIFDRFYRVDEARKRDGTGLGLSIVREVLSYHQATVQIESELGEGTTFIIQFSKL